MVSNVHYRDFNATLAEVGALIDGLSSLEDHLWPYEKWVPMILDQPLREGATGGHGPIGYRVEKYQPGRYVRFRFTSPEGFIGTHIFDIETRDSGMIRLRHTISMRLKGQARFSWTFAIRWLHDALLEDALDKAESHIYSQPWKERKLSPWVKFLLARIERQ